MFQVQPSEHEGQSVLKARGGLTIYDVTDALRTLEAEGAGREDLVLDLADVTEIDSAGVQLLLWLKRETQRGKGTFALVNHGPAVVEVFELLNVTGELGGPVVLIPPGA